MRRVIYFLIFFVLLGLNYALCNYYGVEFSTWKDIQLINLIVFTPMIPMLYFGFQKIPNSIGFIFMFGLTLSIILFKVLADKSLEDIEINKSSKLILLSSFFVYLLKVVLFLIHELKNIEFNTKKR